MDSAELVEFIASISFLTYSLNSIFIRLHTLSSILQPSKSTKKKVKTPSFIVELPLQSSADDEKHLNDRLLCGARLHNVVLRDGIRIVEAMRADPAWAAAKKIKDLELRRSAYQEVRKAHHFVSAYFDKLIAAHAKAARINKRIGSHEMQSIASRVFDSLSKWVFGKGGKPRFKGKVRRLHSLEGKNNDGMFRWLAEEKLFQVQTGWQIKPIFPKLEKNEWLWEALQCRTKYCRLIWRNLNGVKRWFVQLIQEGLPPIKAELLEKMAPAGSMAGFDLGPSSIGICTATAGHLLPLCPEIDRPEAQMRVLQRSIERQRRMANPQNYKDDGTVKRGCRTWVISERQRENQRKLAEIQRKEAASRRCSHGKLVNTMLGMALNWKDDNVSVKSLQRNYGKSVGKRSPGLLVSELKRKAERAGGSRSIIDIRNLKTSQYDHASDSFAKKKLSQRWHVFGDGRGKVQRDVYSAFLAMHSEGSTHNQKGLETVWKALELTLSVAGLCVMQSTNS